MIEYTTILPPLSNSDHNVISFSRIVEVRMSENSTIRIVDYNKADWDRGNTGHRPTRTSRVGWVDNIQRNNRGGPGDIHHHPETCLQGHSNKKGNEKEDKCMDEQKGKESDQKEDEDMEEVQTDRQSGRPRTLSEGTQQGHEDSGEGQGWLQDKACRRNQEGL